MHPLILREMERRLKRLRAGVAVVDAPLLFEAGMQKRFDLTVLVGASAARQESRVMRRDRCGRAQARRKILAQMPMAVKRRRADVVIDNDGARPPFLSRIRSFYQGFRLIAVPPRRTHHGKRHAAP